MPTKKPRVIVTLEPETHDVIQRWATLQGRSRGKVIAELLDSTVGPLSRAVDLMEAAQRAPGDVKTGLVEALTSVETDLLGYYSKYQALREKVENEGEGGESLDLSGSEFEGLPLAPKGGSTPVPVTRGSGRKNPHQNGAKKGRKS